MINQRVIDLRKRVARETEGLTVSQLFEHVRNEAARLFSEADPFSILVVIDPPGPPQEETGYVARLAVGGVIHVRPAGLAGGRGDDCLSVALIDLTGSIAIELEGGIDALYDKKEAQP